MQMGQMRIGDDDEESMMKGRRSGSDVGEGNEDGDDDADNDADDDERCKAVRS